MKPRNLDEVPFPISFPTSLSVWSLIRWAIAIPFSGIILYNWHQAVPLSETYERSYYAMFYLAIFTWYIYIALFCQTVYHMRRQKSYWEQTEGHFIALFTSVFPMLAGFLLMFAHLYCRFHNDPFDTNLEISKNTVLLGIISVFITGWLISIPLLATQLSCYILSGWSAADWQALWRRLHGYWWKAIYGFAGLLALVFLWNVGECIHDFYALFRWHGFVYNIELLSVCLYFGLFVMLAFIMSRRRDYLDNIESYFLSLMTCAFPLVFSLFVVLLNYFYICCEWDKKPSFSMTFREFLASFDFAVLGFYVSCMLICLYICYYLCGFPFSLFGSAPCKSKYITAI